MSPNDPIPQAFVDAVSSRDFVRLRGLLAEGAGMRAVTPTKFIEEAGAQAIVDRFAFWFGDLTRVELRASRAGHVAARGAVHYELRTWDPEGVCDIAQQVFLDEREGRIHRIDLLCSGFQDVVEAA